FFFQAEDGIRDFHVTGVQTCALPIWSDRACGPRIRTAAARPALPAGASADSPPAGSAPSPRPFGYRTRWHTDCGIPGVGAVSSGAILCASNLSADVG